MAIWTPTVKTEKADLIKDLKKMADSIDTEKVQKESGKRLITNEEATKLAGLENYDDSELIKLIDSQNIDIKYLEKQVEQLLKDHKPIPFNGVSNHLVDTGDFPMPISINGGIEQDTREGYNLLKVTGTSKTINGITVTYNEDSSITLNGTATANANIPLWGNYGETDTKFILASGDYTIYAKGKTNGFVNIFDTSKTLIAQTTGNSKIKNFTTSEEKNVGCIYLHVAIDTTYSNETIYPMLVKATYTEATMPPFEQYGSSPSIAFPSEVKGVSGHYDTLVENKNICPTDFNDWESGHYEQNGNKGDYPSRLRLKELLRVKPSETYYFALNTTNKYLRFIIRCYGQNKEFISSYGLLTDGATFVTMDDVYYLGISLYDTTVATDDIYETYKTMFESGNLKPFICLNSETDKTFIEHQEQNLPLDIPIGQVWYSGKPYKENGKWYRPIEWGKYTFTGKETVVVNLNGTNSYNIPFPNYLRNANKVIGYSSHFLGVTFEDRTVNRNNICYFDHGTVDYITFRNTDILTIDDFKAFLTNNNVYVVYKLAKADKKEITDTTLISQLEELQKADSYKEVTNINSYRASEDVAEMKLSGNALMSNDLRMSKLESALLNVSAEV